MGIGWFLLIRMSATYSNRTRTGTRKLGSGATQGRECRNRRKASGKIANERHHCRMPKAIESKKVHFAYGSLSGPLLNSNTISGDENARTIFAEATMDENSFFGVAKERKELRYLVVRWSGPAADGNTDKANA